MPQTITANPEATMIAPLRRAVLLTTATATLALAGPANALTGASTDTTHRAVGMLMPRPDNGKFCGGTLISATVFLTAGHCVAGRLGLGATTWSVSFSPDPLSDPGTTYTGRLVLDPDYRANGGTAADDLGAVVFATPVPGITPIPVAPDLSSDALQHSTLTLVGYGYTSTSQGAGGTTYSDEGTRTSGPASYQNLTNEWTTVTADGGSAACQGDSGGAFLMDEQFVGVISTGTPTCNTWTGATRLDTPSAKAFLAGLH